MQDNGLDDVLSSSPASVLVQPTGVAVRVEGGVGDAQIVAQAEASMFKADDGTDCGVPPESHMFSVGTCAARGWDDCGCVIRTSECS